MSQENLEIIRRMHDHFDAAGEPLWDVISDEGEVHDHDIPDAGSYRGHAGWVQWLTDWSAGWQSFEMKLDRVVDTGDQVVSLFRTRATGRSSGIELDRDDAMVWTIRDGMVVRLDYYNDQHQALAAAGLPQ